MCRSKRQLAVRRIWRHAGCSLLHAFDSGAGCLLRSSIAAASPVAPAGLCAGRLGPRCAAGTPSPSSALPLARLLAGTSPHPLPGVPRISYKHNGSSLWENLYLSIRRHSGWMILVVPWELPGFGCAVQCATNPPSELPGWMHRQHMQTLAVVTMHNVTGMVKGMMTGTCRAQCPAAG